jgi:hypothetical protein
MQKPVHRVSPADFVAPSEARILLHISRGSKPPTCGSSSGLGSSGHSISKRSKSIGHDTSAADLPSADEVIEQTPAERRLWVTGPERLMPSNSSCH